MDAQARKALIDELSVRANFEKSYSEPNRRWFVDKVIRVYEGKNLADDEIKQKTQDAVLKSKAIVTSKRDIKLSLGLNAKRKATERKALPRRVQILYGAIAFAPEEFLDSANSPFLDFIAKRRYRSVERMDLFVNPNRLGFFYYPDRCKSDSHWRVNSDAAALWQRVVPNSDIPIAVVPDAQGNVDLVKAINKLFVSKDANNPCVDNLFDCSTTLCIVFLDSLLEARDPAALYKELDSRSLILVPHTYADIYLVSDWSMAKPDYFFVLDSRPNALFTTGDSEMSDFQIGDHVYIWNHPLYRVFRPKGSWRGEHSLVTDCGDRSYSSENGPQFKGHGLSGTIQQFYSQHLKELQTLVHRTFRIGLTFLRYRQNPGSPISAHVTKETHNLTDSSGNTHITDIYLFDIDFSYPDYEAAASGQDKKTKGEHGFVIVEPTDLDQFGIHYKRTIAEAIADDPLNNVIRFDRYPSPPAPGTDPYDPKAWMVPYRDPTSGEIIPYPIFFQNGSSVDVRQLNMKNLKSFPFGKQHANSPATYGYMTRPKVDFTKTYVDFLTNKGAI